MINTQSFILDIKKPTIRKLKVVNGDTANRFVITVQDNGNAVTLDADLHKVIAVFTRADGEVYTQDADTGLSFTTGGVVTIDVYSSSFRTGTNKVCLQIYKRENSSATEYPLLCTTGEQAFTARAAAIPEAGAPNAPSQLPMLEKYVLSAKSWAVGGTGKRDGEDIDNAKYYSDLAREEFVEDTVNPSIVAWMDANSEDVDNAIGDWLDAHPEATTTVEDNAVTFQKLYADLKQTTRNLNTKGIGRYRSNNSAPTFISNNNYVGMTDMIPCDASTKYTATFYNVGTGTIRASYFASDKTYLSENHASSITKLTFTTPANAAYVHVWTYSGNGLTINDNSHIQVEKGETSTTYVPPYSLIDSIARDEIDELETSLSVTNANVVRNKNVLAQLQYEKIGRYVWHCGVTYNDFYTIPSQSVFDIERAKRLGFKAIELNVLTTSDGKFITTHGTGGKFGNAFTSLDEADIENTLVNSVTLDYIKANVRYKSTLDKYKVAPPTLEETLIACHNFEIIPAIQYVSGVIEIADEIIGKDNYILNLYTNDRPDGYEGTCGSWLTLNTEENVLAKCNASGGAYMAGFNTTNAAYSSFTDETWMSMFRMLHENGYRSMSAYLSDPMKCHKFVKAGLDHVFTVYQIPDIISGNICNLTDNETWADFTTTGTASNNAVTLTTGQTIKPRETFDSVFLGGGALHIRFNGSIYIKMGHYINNSYTLTSDGTEDIFISTYFEREAPTFMIAATGNTTVYELTYKANEV